MTYPYIELDLLDNPERYSFPNVSAENYIDNFNHSRLQFLQKIPKYILSCSTSRELSLESMRNNIRTFELKKCLFPIQTLNDKKKNIKHLVVLAVNIVTVNVTTFDYGEFSCLLKIHDTLISLPFELYEQQELAQLLFSIKAEINLLKGVIDGQNV